jgi:hypothetical protein
VTGGALDASVTLDEVLTAVAARRVPLAPELAGYLVLEIAEQADPMGGKVDPKSVLVGEEGTVTLVNPKGYRTTGDAEASLRDVLGGLLEASGSQTPALAGASKRKTGAGLAALTQELDAALIPVNRAAGRRALARLAREVRRVTLGIGPHAAASSSSPPSARSPAATAFSPEEDSTVARPRLPKDALNPRSPLDPSEMPTLAFAPDERPPSELEADVDSLIARFGVSGGTDKQHARALKAIAELEPTPPAPSQLAERSSAGESDVEALLGMRTDPSAAPAPAPPSKRAAARAPATARQLPTQPPYLKMGGPTSSSVPTRSRGTGWWSLGVFGMVAIAAGSYAMWRLRPDSLAPRQSPATESTALAPLETQPPCIGALVVTDVPPRAEVLLHEGQAPVDIPRMPVGARLEFVATAEGYAPKRVVVPASADWDKGADGRARFEAAVQLDASHSRVGFNDPWPPGEPGSAVGGEGPPGTVRIVATPHGAEVWMLAGIAPDARIEHLRCDQDIDVLLAGPTTYRKRLRVSAADFVPNETPGPKSANGDPRVARVSAK